LEFGWLYSLSVMTKQPYRQQILYGEDNTTVVDIIFIVSTEAEFLDVIGKPVLRVKLVFNVNIVHRNLIMRSQKV
jgi:hypothetical protein